MTSSRPRQTHPNTVFRQLRGDLSPGEFAAAVRRAAREIGEQVSCDARYVGRVESGEIKCPNYAYERVFRHMFPGSSLLDLGFVPRETVRGNRSPRAAGASGLTAPAAVSGSSAGKRSPRPPLSASPAESRTRPPTGQPRRDPAGDGDGSPGGQGTAHERESGNATRCDDHHGYDEHHEENDVLRRAFMTGGPAAVVATLSLEPSTAQAADATGPGAAAHTQSPATGGSRVSRRVGASEARAVEQAVHRIRLLDDRHGGDTLYQRAGRSLRTAYLLLDEGEYGDDLAGRLHSGAGELAISVGWLAHDSGLLGDARSYYAEALATARVSGDTALEAHSFCNLAFLARDAGRPREAVRAAQAGQQAAKHLASPRLLSLLALREAGGWAGLRDRSACERSLARATTLFAKGSGDADPAWMSFYGEAELAGLEAQIWSALGRYDRAAERARLAVTLQDPHFARNIALYTAELADDLSGAGEFAEAAGHGHRVLDMLDAIHSSRVRRMIAATARALGAHRRTPEVAEFLAAHSDKRYPAPLPA